jgi:hypothetical protein
MDAFEHGGLEIPAGEDPLTDVHSSLAMAHSAMHATKLGVARWSSGNTYTQMEIASALMPTSQVDWHAKAQKNFMAWLDGGGFASPVAPSVEAGADGCQARAAVGHKHAFVG